MVLVASLGHEVPEITLRQLCECDDEGTTKSKAVDCAKHYGFVELFSAYLHLEELEAELARGLYPIVYLQPSLSSAQDQHAVVVTEIAPDLVHVLDPHPLFGGERDLKKEDFNRAWRSMNGLTILVQ